MKSRKISEIGEVIRGVTFDKSESIDLPLDGYLPILRAGNITESGLDLENDIMWVPQSRISDNQILKPNDVVICMASGSAKVLGKNAQLKRAWKGSVGAFCAIVRFGNGINSQFGAYWLKSSEFIQWRDSQEKGANIQNLRKSSLEELEIPIPPLPEQERIVRLLDEAESLRATRERANVRMEQFVPALFQEMFGDPGTNAKGWQVSKIENLLLLSPNYASMIPVRNNNGEWINLRVANIQNGSLDLTDTKYIDLPDEVISRHTVQDGDLLLARAIGSREHLGKCVVVYPGNNKWAFDSHMMRVRPNQEKILPLYLHAFLTSSGGRDIFLQNTRQSAVQFNINTKEFTSIQIPLPPLALQREFAARVEAARGVQSAQGKSAGRVEALVQSMLSRAFAGEL